MSGKDEYLDIVICVWGDHNTGKRCLVERFLNKQYQPSVDSPTTIDSHYRRFILNGITIDLDLHVIPADIKEDDPHLQTVLQRCVSNILCYCAKDFHGLETIKSKWYPLSISVKERAVATFVETKADRLTELERAEHKNEGRDEAYSKNSYWKRCSSKANENITDVMEEAITSGITRRISELTISKTFITKPEVSEHPRSILQGLFAPQICSICQNGIEYKEYYSQCFGGECRNLKALFCDSCLKENPHEHKVFREQLNRGSGKLKGDLVRKTFVNVFEKYSPRPIFGWSTRNSRRTTNGELFVHTHDDKLEWITYREFYRRALFIARGLMKFTGVKPGDFVGICGRNRVEWFLTSIGCSLHTMRSIAVHTSYQVEDLNHLANNAQLKGVVCGKQEMNNFFNLLSKYPNVIKFIVCMDPLSEEEISSLRQEHQLPDTILLSSLEAVEAIGQTTRPFEDSELSGHCSKSIFTLQYTSGSTGKPKGVVITDEAFNYDLVSRGSSTDRGLTVSYEPLAHSSFDNDVIHFCSGSPIVLYEDDMGDQFFADLQVSNPTSMAGVPRIYNSIHSQYKLLLDQRILNAGDITREEKKKIEDECTEAFRFTFGTRILYLTIGGAPSSTQVRDFMKKTFQTFVFNSYGTTESGGISANGTKSFGVEMVLVDCPELGFLTTDKPFPRGEIAVRTKTQGKGYYREPELTNETWTEEGFVRTGDIAVLEADNQFRIITRRKNICKLAQGEYVDPDKLGNIYLESRLVDQVYVDINSLQTYVAAIIVPIFPLLIKRMNKEFNESLEDTIEVRQNLCNDKRVIDIFLKEFKNLADLNQLLSFEYIHGIVITSEPFTIENGLQTASNKLCRFKIQKKYEYLLNEVYGEIDVSQYKDAASHISQMMNNVLGNDASDGNFIERGGDSLSALNLIQLLKDKYNVEVPLDYLYNSESNSPQKLAELIAKEKLDATPESREKLQMRIDQDKILPIDIVPVIDSTYTEIPSRILLTGASGFIGMYLLVEILKVFPDAKVDCMIRSISKEKYIKNLEKAEILLSEEDKERFNVFKGDLSKPLFGLDEKDYNELCGSIDWVYHCGAHVNHFLQYEHLYEPNVEGTKRILRFCCQMKQKYLHHISTVGVLLSDRSREDPPLDELPCPLGSGYGASKFVGELLVLQASKRGVPVSIYRPSQIAGHSITGHCIPEHYINRLLLAFLQLEQMPNTSSKIELTAVDFCSEVIVALSKCKESLGQTFNVSDPKSTVRLDSLKDCLVKFGLKIESLSVSEWIGSLYDLLYQSQNSTDDKINYTLLKPLASYFDRQMSQFPSTFTPYIKNMENILNQNNCYPKQTGGLSDDRVNATIKYLSGIVPPRKESETE